MTIGIVTYFFHPVLNPRAFRALELAKEFSRQGHRVIVYVPDTDYDYTELSKRYNISIECVAPGFYLNKKGRPVNSAPAEVGEVSTTKSKPGLMQRFKYQVIRNFYPGGFNFEYAFTCSRALKRANVTFDLMISVGLPICTHLAVSRASRMNRKKIKTRVADYGDPYSFSKIIHPPYFHRWLERRMLRQFDFILTPTEKGVQSFTYFKPADKIRIIPQAFDFSEIKRSDKLHESGIKHFVFSGNFYKDARNPRELFTFLSTLEIDFRFILYINMSDTDNMDIVRSFAGLLGDKLVVRPFVPRLDCIFEMSKADFLINISNTHTEHTPSKLIDYKLTGRPVFSYVPGSFDEIVFRNFLGGDYKSDFVKDLSLDKYDIRKVSADILSLIKERGQ